MASEQKTGGAKVDVGVEKDLVPKMASHYDTLAEKSKDSPIVPSGKDEKVQGPGKDDDRKSSGEELLQKQGKNQGSAVKAEGGKEEVLDDRTREKVSSAKDAVAGITERTKELVIGKTEEETRDRQKKVAEDEQGESYRAKDGGGAKEGKVGGVLGVVREALVEIAASTKDLVCGKGKCEDRDVVYDLGYGGGRGEKEHQG